MEMPSGSRPSCSSGLENGLLFECIKDSLAETAVKFVSLSAGIAAMVPVFSGAPRRCLVSEFTFKLWEGRSIQNRDACMRRKVSMKAAYERILDAFAEAENPEACGKMRTLSCTAYGSVLAEKSAFYIIYIYIYVYHDSLMDHVDSCIFVPAGSRGRHAVDWCNE